MAMFSMEGEKIERWEKNLLSCSIGRERKKVKKKNPSLCLAYRFKKRMKNKIVINLLFHV